MQPPDADTDLVVTAETFEQPAAPRKLRPEWLSGREVMLHYRDGLAVRVDRKSSVDGGSVTQERNGTSIVVLSAERGDALSLIPLVNALLDRCDTLPADPTKKQIRRAFDPLKGVHEELDAGPRGV